LSEYVSRWLGSLFPRANKQQLGKRGREWMDKLRDFETPVKLSQEASVRK
jgi:hypothetical protein